MSYQDNKDGIPVIHMRPLASLDYPMEWADWLEGQGIASYSVEVPPGITKVSVMLDGSTVVGWFKAPAGSYRYKVTYNITTNSSPPREMSQDIILDVRP